MENIDVGGYFYCGREIMNMQGEYDNYDYQTSAEMTLDEQIDSAKQALASAIQLLKDDESDYLNNKVKEIGHRWHILLLLEEYGLKERLEKMTVEQLEGRLEIIADEIFAIKDGIICKNCHKGKIKVFEDRGGYSVRCDYCNTTNYCRCETKEMAIRFWNRGITKA